MISYCNIILHILHNDLHPICSYTNRLLRVSRNDQWFPLYDIVPTMKTLTPF